MGRQIFDYEHKSVCEEDPLYYGFHKKNGRIHIDTKRLKKVIKRFGCEVEHFFPESFLSYSRNTHYFVPKKRTRYGYRANYLKDCVLYFEKEWSNEYLPMIDSIKTPEEVCSESITNNIAYYSNKDDYDSIYETANILKVLRASKYHELIKSIQIQYLQKVTSEFMRRIFVVIKSKSEKFGFGTVLSFVQKRFKKQKDERNPIKNLEHYKYFVLASGLSNFAKHNSMDSYMYLYNNPLEDDPEIKIFTASYLYDGGDNHEYENGMYALPWIKMDNDILLDIMHGLEAFSDEFCELVFKEDPSETYWNYDEYLSKCLRKFIYGVVCPELEPGLF